jgi:hypothetical protein
MFKLFGVLILVAGEATAIYAEMIAARNFGTVDRPFLQVFLKVFLIMVLAAGILMTGYMLNYRSFKNIWVVSVISITSILFLEPLLAYTLFRQLPTRGALIGLVLGALGFIATIFF